MKRFFLLAICLFLSIGASYAFGASILVSQTVGVDGYGGSAWSNMTSALDSATGNNVTVVSNFENLNLMLTYDALWLDLRGRGINDPPDLLSAVEVANLTSFINTGKRVVMIGEWGNIENPPHFVEDWNIQILSIVGGTFVGTPDEALTAIMYPEISHDLTNGVSQIDLTGNSIGVADGGTSLFNYNFATLWGNNVLTILDNGIFGDIFWSDADNSFFATNVANWVASPNEQAQYVFEQGLNGYFGVIDTSVVDSPVGVGNWGTFYPDAPADDAPLLLSGINRQTLIQFQGIFGALPGQIPYGSTIDSATLEFGSRNGSAQTHELYMMISSWEGSITWNSAGSGIQMDGIEASSSVVDSIIPVQDGGSFDVTSSVSDWSSGTPNNGWILTGTTPDDWTMFSSESQTAPGTNPLDRGPIPRLTITVVIPEDSDGDGIPDDVDTCPNSDLSETVIIDSWDTGVDNVLLEDGCTISDLISQCADDAYNHGEFVSAVSQTTNALKKEGVISGKDKGRIQKGAAKAAIP